MINNKIEDILHKIRGQFHVLSNFIDCLERKINVNGKQVQADEINEYCSIVIGSMHEIIDLIEEIKNDAN